MWYKKTVKNKKTTVTKIIEKIIADPINNKYQTSTYVKYINGVVSASDDLTYDWTDVIPGTMAGEFIKFAKSVNNHVIRDNLWWNAFNNRKFYPPLTETE